ncbi:MAG: DUF4372 domain-containing protein [Bacteroidales bacterium]|nr:DUF4372 domain-containing protein [Bacteroidales bacterium]
MNEGKYILTQVTSFIPRQIFLRLVEKFKGDYRVREFNCTNQLQYMLFGQLTPCESLRDICLCIGQNKDAKTYIDYIVPQDHELYAFDSTTMSCSVKLMEWALGKYSKGGVKMHTLIDLRGSIPVFIHITDGRYHDSNAMDLLEIVPNAIYTMDKAYVDFEALARIDAEGGIFMLRAKDNMKCEIVSTNFNVDTSTGLLEDHIIRLTGVKSQKLYPMAEMMEATGLPAESGNIRWTGWRDNSPLALVSYTYFCT